MNEGFFKRTLLEDETPSEGVITAIASLKDCEPTALTPRLYSAIDPDALDHLFQPTIGSRDPRPIRVMFTYENYDITVHGDGSIEIQPPERPSTDASSR